MKIKLLISLSILGSSTLFAPLDTKKIPELLEGVENKIPVAIIGGGPAGYAAAIPPIRSGYYTVIFQGPKPGGELSEAQIVENWPGLPKETGAANMKKLERQVAEFGAQLVPLMVTEVDFTQWPYALTLNDGTVVHAFTVICATGSTQRKLGIEGESTYWGKGLFSCGLCDGTYARGKDTVIIGGGDIAIQRALQLVSLAKSVSLIVPGPRMSAHETMQDKIKNIPSIQVLYNKQVKAIEGTEKAVTQVRLYDTATGKTSTLKTSSVFLSTGLTPNTELFHGKLSCEKNGCITLLDSRSQKTSIEGVMAAGTVSDADYRQVGAITGDGTKAGMDALHFLSKWGFDGPLRKLAKEDLYKPPVIPHPSIKHLITLQEFAKATRAKKPVLVEFYSPSCTSCRKMEGPLTAVTETYKSALDVYKVDRDVLYPLIEKYDINIIPAFFMFRNGKELKRLEGEASRNALSEFIKTGLTQDPQMPLRAVSTCQLEHR